MKIEKSLSIIRRPNLTKGQKDLLNLITEKLEKKEMILFSESKEIWLNKVCRNISNGIPQYYNYFKGRYEENGEIKFKGGFEPMTKEQVTYRVLLWLTGNIGALVLKGYLKVIPAIEVKKLI